MALAWDRFSRIVWQSAPAEDKRPPGFVETNWLTGEQVTFQLEVDQELVIDDATHLVTEHPSAPGMPYGQEGRAAIVYQLVVGPDRRALKVFKPRYRTPGLVSLAERIEPYADLPGLLVCRRTVLNARRHKALLSQYSDLTYAVLMPWVAGPTWMEVMLAKRQLAPEESLDVARGLVEVLVVMEEQELAHCDLSAPNVMLPALAGGKGVELVDVEGMYGADLKRPREILSNSPGYGHKTANEQVWRPEVDRFAGAVLLAEMLGWCDERVREAAVGDPGYFSQEEVQQEGERYRVLMAALESQGGNQVANLFERAWRSEKLWDCPTFGEWMVALPEKSLALKEQEQVKQARSGQLVEATENNEVQSLLGTARRLQEKGRFDVALEVYRQIWEMAPTGSGLRDELAIIVRDLEGQQEEKESLSSKDAEETTLAALFDDGLAAYRKGEWTKAKELWMEVVRREPGYIRDGKLVTAFLAKAQKREKNRQYSVFRWGWLLVLGAVLFCAILASLLVSWWERRDMAGPPFQTETVAATFTRTPTPEFTIMSTRTTLPILASRLPILTSPTPIPTSTHMPTEVVTPSPLSSDTPTVVTRESTVAPISTASMSEPTLELCSLSLGVASSSSPLHAGMWVDRGQDVTLRWGVGVDTIDCTSIVNYYVVAVDGQDVCRTPHDFQWRGSGYLWSKAVCYFQIPAHLSVGQHFLTIIPYSADGIAISTEYGQMFTNLFSGYPAIDFNVNP
jgi:tetratricopeptide (TPR) repeat protein